VATRWGRGPLQQLFARGYLDEAGVARARARVLGIDYGGDQGEDTVKLLGLPPDSGLGGGGLKVMLVTGGLMLEHPCPEPWMTAEVAQLFPEQPIRWRVSPVGLPLSGEEEVTDGVLQRRVSA
jgi:hypothetical protein